MQNLTEEEIKARREQEEQRELERAYQLKWAGKQDEAFEILWRHCLIKLNKVI